MELSLLFSSFRGFTKLNRTHFILESHALQRHHYGFPHLSVKIEIKCKCPLHDHECFFFGISDKLPPAVLVTVNCHFQLARNSNFYSLNSRVIDVAMVVFESNPFVQRLAESQTYENGVRNWCYSHKTEKLN